MNILFVGVGSIARRHISNLHKLYSNIEIDVLRTGKGKALNYDIAHLIKKEFYSIGMIKDSYDVIFVTNPTELHYKTLMALNNYSNNFFIEKPVFSNENVSIENFVQDDCKTYYVACPIRYNNVIQYLKKNVDYSEVFSARSICSSYLPDWRKGIDYRESYSAQKALGGGVSIDLIHEWDYLTYLMGFPQKTSSFIDKVSKLEIDSDDIAIYVGKYLDKYIELHLDYFGRKAVRNIELYLCDETIRGDIQNGMVYFLRSGEEIDCSEERDSYQVRELEHFFDIVNGKCRNDNDISNAVKVLKLAKGALG